MLRRLYLGSVSSLSFEEEENEFCFNRNKNDGGGGQDHAQDTQLLQQQQQHYHHHHHHHPEVDQRMELHEMLTDRLYEQVESLLRCSSYLNRSSGDDLTLRLLRSTLSEAVHQILHLSEDEPYGVRGATIKLRIKDVEGNVQTLGNIVVDNNTVSTFNLILNLEEEKRLSLSIKNWIYQLTGSRQDHLIGPRFTLRKEKLYRTSSGSSLESFE